MAKKVAKKSSKKVTTKYPKKLTMASKVVSKSHLELKLPEQLFGVRVDSVRKGDMVLIVGPTDVGKSVFTLNMAYDIALGRNSYGNTLVPRKVKTKCVLLEYDVIDQIINLRGMYTHSGVSVTTNKKSKTTFTLADQDEVAEWRNNFFVNLQKAVDDGHELIVVDNLNQLKGVSKTGSSAIQNFLTKTKEILKNKAVLILVMHTPKSKNRNLTSPAQLAKGGSEWGDSARLVMTVQEISEADQVYEVLFLKKADAVRGDKKDFKIYVTRTKNSSDDPTPYFVEIKYTKSDRIENRTSRSGKKYTSYANLGLEFLPPLTREDIISYLEQVNEKFNLNIKSVKDACNSIMRHKLYFDEYDEKTFKAEMNTFQQHMSTKVKALIGRANNKQIKLPRDLEWLKTQYDNLTEFLKNPPSGSTIYYGKKYIELLYECFDYIQPANQIHRKLPIIPNMFDDWLDLSVGKKYIKTEKYAAYYAKK